MPKSRQLSAKLSSKGQVVIPIDVRKRLGTRDPEMHQTKKGKQWYFGMKAHIGADAESGLVHTVRGTAANVCDVVEANSLLHGEESDVFGDAGYQVRTSEPMWRRASSGTWRCARASVQRWTSSIPPMR